MGFLLTTPYDIENMVSTNGVLLIGAAMLAASDSDLNALTCVSYYYP